MALILPSCSTIVSKSDYPVTFTSSKPTSMKVVNEKSGQVVLQAQTPTTATLSASSGFFQPAKYSVMTEGSTQSLSASMDPWYAGNIVFGGFLGLLVVDPATGNMWKLPREVIVNPGQE